MAVNQNIGEVVNTISSLTGAINPGVKRVLPRHRLSKEVTKHVKILTLDIETAPALSYHWGMFKQNIGLNQMVEQGRILCVVAKWYDKKTPIFLSDFHDGHEAMIQKMWELVNEADIIVHFNGKSFDMRWLDTEFFLAGLSPTSPYKNVDLLLAARKKFRFISNKLDNLAEQTGLGNKTSHTGFSLWTGCMANDPKSWALMKKYNLQDVKLTEDLYDTMRPWIESHPHLGMWTGLEWCCPSCGHKDVSNHRSGTARANVQQYRQYQCPECGTWIRGNKKLADPTATRISRVI